MALFITLLIMGVMLLAFGPLGAILAIILLVITLFLWGFISEILED